MVQCKWNLNNKRNIYIEFLLLMLRLIYDYVTLEMTDAANAARRFSSMPSSV